MLNVNASNGGGLISRESIAEAIGMFLIDAATLIPSLDDKPIRDTTGLIELIDTENNGNSSYHYTYKGNVYRVGYFKHKSPRWDNMHFDYLRPE